jgi:hypothetical protein
MCKILGSILLFQILAVSLCRAQTTSDDGVPSESNAQDFFKCCLHPLLAGLADTASSLASYRRMCAEMFAIMK